MGKLRLYLSLLGFRRAAFLAIAALVVAALVLAALLTVAAQASASFGTLVVESDPVEIRRGGDWGPVADGEVLAAGTSVRTGATGRALITFADGSSVELDGSAEISLDGLSRAGNDSIAVRMTQSLGRVWANLLRGTNSGGKVELRTHAATVFVRGGTSFTVAVDPNAAKLQVAEGTVQFGVRTVFPGAETIARGGGVALANQIAPGPGMEFVATNARLTVLDPRLRPIHGFRIGGGAARETDRALFGFDYFADPQQVAGEYTLLVRSATGGPATLDVRALFGDGLTAGVTRSVTLPPGGSARTRVTVSLDAGRRIVLGTPSSLEVLGSICEAEARDRSFATGTLDDRARGLLAYSQANPGKRVGVVVTNADLESAVSGTLGRLKDSPVRFRQLTATTDRGGVHLVGQAGAGPLEVNAVAELALGMEDRRFVVKVRSLDLGTLSFLANGVREQIELGLGEALAGVGAGAPVTWDRVALYEGCAGLFGTTR
jgi:hypothetical protein